MGERDVRAEGKDSLAYKVVGGAPQIRVEVRDEGARGGCTHLYKETKVVFKLLQKKTAQSE